MKLADNLHQPVEAWKTGSFLNDQKQYKMQGHF